MFVEFITDFLTILINAETAQIFAVPMAVFLCFMLLFFLFTMFSNSSVKRVILILICVLVGAFTIFTIAESFGMVILPVSLGG